MTPITTPFGFSSTAADVMAGISLSGKRAIVTGASSGIGIETARALAGAGAQVTLAVRNSCWRGSSAPFSQWEKSGAFTRVGGMTARSISIGGSWAGHAEWSS